MCDNDRDVNPYSFVEDEVSGLRLIVEDMQEEIESLSNEVVRLSDRVAKLETELRDAKRELALERMKTDEKPCCSGPCGC